MNSQVFTLIACRRTGSNYLMKILDSFSNMEFFGEVYHNQTVWMPTSRKFDFVEWLKDKHDLEIKIGEKPFEDKDLVRFNHEHPEHFLNFLNSFSPKQYAGFKIFPEHLRWHKLKTNLLTNKKVIKIVMRRNLLDVYISDKILEMTKSSQKQDTSDIKLNIDCLDFKTWYFDKMSFYSRVESCLRNSGQQYFELSYEDIHCHSSDDEKVRYIQSWLKQSGIEINDRPQISDYVKKQDKRKNSLEKIQNDQELKSYLLNHNLQHLVHS